MHSKNLPGKPVSFFGNRWQKLNVKFNFMPTPKDEAMFGDVDDRWRRIRHAVKSRGILPDAAPRGMVLVRFTPVHGEVPMLELNDPSLAHRDDYLVPDYIRRRGIK